MKTFNQLIQQWQDLLYDMLLIALCALISGADSWTHVVEYGRRNERWFKLLKISLSRS
jgi:hypothetical protein